LLRVCVFLILAVRVFLTARAALFATEPMGIRFAVEFMITRIDATRSGLKPSRRPISSGDGTRLVITKAAMAVL
jgi:hypothetical protein